MRPIRILGALSKTPFGEIFVGLVLLVSACISIYLTRVPGGIALFWPGSAMAAALLIRLPQVRWSIASMSVWIALLVANVLAAHRPWPVTGLFACINVSEIALMVAVFRFAWRFPYPHISILQAAVMVAIFGILIPGVAAMAGGWALRQLRSGACQVHRGKNIASAESPRNRLGGNALQRQRKHRHGHERGRHAGREGLVGGRRQGLLCGETSGPGTS
jgi:hypothetical protein